MSTWLDYELEVLASDPKELGIIAAELRHPSTELAKWIRQVFGESVSANTEALKKLLDFQTVQNLTSVQCSRNKTRSFRLSFNTEFFRIIRRHLGEISKTFPEAIFLLQYSDRRYRYRGKEVIRDAVIVQHIVDDHHLGPSLVWMLLDIFAPYRVEFNEGLSFGSLWQEWLQDLVCAVRELRFRSFGCTPLTVRSRSHGAVQSNDDRITKVNRRNRRGSPKKGSPVKRQSG